MRLLELLKLKKEIRHKSGPKRASVGPRGLVVCALVRNGACYIPAFLEHYRAFGDTHFVFLDNGSSDNFLDLVGNEPDITVLSTSLAYKTHKYIFKQYLARKFGRGRWVAMVDIDELLDVPLRGRATFADVIDYLEAHHYTAVTAQMLDMFSDRDLGDVGHGDAADLKTAFPWYELADIARGPIDNKKLGNRIANSEIQWRFGGIRERHFGVKPMLTKYPLVKMVRAIRVVPNSAHTVKNARIADFSAVLLHYKFMDDFATRAENAVARGAYYDDSAEYRAYLMRLNSRANFSLKTEDSRYLAGVDQLVDEGFLDVTSEYLQFMQNRSSAAALV